MLPDCSGSSRFGVCHQAVPHESRVCTSSTIIYAIVDIGNTAAGLHRAGYPTSPK